jgi:hypothetical protein
MEKSLAEKMNLDAEEQKDTETAATDSLNTSGISGDSGD